MEHEVMPPLRRLLGRAACLWLGGAPASCSQTRWAVVCLRAGQRGVPHLAPVAVAANVSATCGAAPVGCRHHGGGESLSHPFPTSAYRR